MITMLTNSERPSGGPTNPGEALRGDVVRKKKQEDWRTILGKLEPEERERVIKSVADAEGRSRIERVVAEAMRILAAKERNSKRMIVCRAGLAVHPRGRSRQRG